MEYLRIKTRQGHKEEIVSSSQQKNELHVVFITYVLELYYIFHVLTYPVTKTTSGIKWELERPRYLVSFDRPTRIIEFTW